MEASFDMVGGWLVQSGDERDVRLIDLNYKLMLEVMIATANTWTGGHPTFRRAA